MKDMVILVNFLPAVGVSYTNKGSIYPSTSILLIGSYLTRNGYKVRIIDGAYDQDYKDKLKSVLNDMEGQILFVGMSVMVTQIPFALEASKIVKGVNPDIHVVWGGPHPTLYPEQTLRDDHVDIVVINEGTSTALDISRSLARDSDLGLIPGIGYKDAEKVKHFTHPASLDDINDLPFFDFSLIETEHYLNPKTASVYKREFPHYKNELRIMPILAGLGCPYKCQFCINVILKRRYRYRSARAIVDEIKHLQDRYSANTFLFLDEDFFINKKRIIELVSICEAENLHFNFRAWCRVDHFKESYLNVDLLKRLSNVGHISLVMGGESASPEILIDLKKEITPGQIINSLKVITESDKRIFPRYSFMVGLENETMSQIRETYRFCMEMQKINSSVDIAGPFIFRLYPGSPIFERITRDYKIKIPDSLESWSLHTSNAGSSEEMPWTPEEFQKNKDLIAFYSVYALSRPIGISFWSIKGMAKIILIYISKFRMRHFFFGFPFEYWLFSLVMSEIEEKGK
jgi:anaerobic magnesium-protoporphyrin IX monomethyl ester cyclase